MNRSPVLWDSELSAQAVATGACLLAEPWVDSKRFYWLQSLPAEGGRITVMAAAACATPRSLVTAPLSVRSRVNEYGGGAYAVAPAALWFVNDEDQALWRVTADGGGPVFRREGVALGDLAWDSARRRILAVAEDRYAPRQVCQRLIAIGEGGEVTVLASGADFYAAPRPAPNGAALAWLEWSAPDMPWDVTRLMYARINERGNVIDIHPVAGGSGESLAQPEWSPEGDLYVVSDREGGFWNLHRVSENGLEAVRRAPAECARPAFVFAQRQYAFTPAGGLILAEVGDGLWRCLEGRRDGGDFKGILPGLTEIAGVAAGSAGIAVLGGGATEPLALWARAGAEPEFRRLAGSLDFALDPGYLSKVESLNFASADGAITHGLYFPPAHPRMHVAGAVPVRVRCHGGPTSAASSALESKTLYWTSRGFGVLELNYRGSSGYGRSYREALYGNWGVVDVADAWAAARGLVAAGVADPRSLVIAGGSAGGLTVLLALIGDSPYAAGASYYGVTDLARLAQHTHRFESHYGDRLVGPWPAARALYLERSPLERMEEITCPVIFFQGLNDPVVPPAQSERMARALAGRGVTVAYETFAGERHGFRRPETIARTLAAELDFYVRVLDSAPSATLDPNPG
ncbi:MAG: S9 family peptidase [Gammaproteobacteria bacterium]